MRPSPDRDGLCRFQIEADSLRGIETVSEAFPSVGVRFDSHRPLQYSAKFTLIRLPLLTGHPSICARKAGVLRPFCAQVDRSSYKLTSVYRYRERESKV